ncbi:CGNR zinc finger domain-containing protein [Sphaerisporangium aureirubrum]|uniref:CGNR zinc finger domain-containing protein n=1 Tax=Sphaerisporangium aureirubrum TaxID=1544736 RepID=A0ABW1NQY8_9ACTN
MESVYLTGRPALDFAGTLRWRTSRCEDLLPSPAAFSAWAERAGLVTEPVPVGADDFPRLIRLREAIYRLATARLRAEPWGGCDLDVLNAAAAAPPVSIHLTEDGTLCRRGDSCAVGSVLARDAIDLLGGVDARRIRECAGQGCTRLYVDHSRGATRRWCDMTECGNKSKAASYRRRRATPGHLP